MGLRCLAQRQLGREALLASRPTRVSPYEDGVELVPA
jgi:hypothetical protein